MSNARTLADLMGTSTTVPSSKLSLGAADMPSGSVLQVKNISDGVEKAPTLSSNKAYTGYSIVLDNNLQSTSSFIILMTSLFVGVVQNTTLALNWSSSNTTLTRLNPATDSVNDFTTTEVYPGGSTNRNGMGCSFVKKIDVSSVTPATYYLWITEAAGTQPYINSSSNGNEAASLGPSGYWVGSGTTSITAMEIAG